MREADLRRELNPAQLAAVLATEGPMLVFAGAGSGKTRVITYRAAHIVIDRDVAPWRVMCVTFTNKAAGEMRERLEKLLGTEGAHAMWIHTFHATGAKLLRRYHERVGLSRSFVIFDDGDTRSVMNRVFDELKLDEKLLEPRAALSAIDRFKQEAMSPEMVAERADGPHEMRLAMAYASYEKRLRASNAVDFGDLLKKMVDLLENDEHVRTELQQRFRYVMIDEFQDTNAAQYRIVRALVGPERNICVVGDDDQAIYKWRGADVRNIRFFKSDYPDAKVVMLEQNYRSTGKILRAANAVIEKLHTREKKVLFTENGDGVPVDAIAARDEREEAERVASMVKEARRNGTALRDIAVFYRIHAQSRPLEEAIRGADLPYVIVGGTRFYERAEVKDVLAYLRLVLNPHDDVSLVRVINQPPRGIGKTTVDRLIAQADRQGVSVWSVLERQDMPDDIQKAARKKLDEFVETLMAVARQALEHPDRPDEIAGFVVQRTGYDTMLSSDRSPENEARMENLRELIGSMEAYASENAQPSLGDYLERVTLAEETAGARDKEADRLSLMTVHGAKGLEFDTVFVTGLEQGMFPYKGTQPGGTPDELEEERRLAYVAITRARRKLVLTWAVYRQIFGTTRVNPPSQFLYELPDDVLTRPIQRPRYGSALPGTGERPSAPAPRDNGGNGELRVVYDDDAPVPGGGGSAHGFRTGMMVKHAKFGVGRVRSVEPGSELKLGVYFPSLGAEKKVLAEFVQVVG